MKRVIYFLLLFNPGLLQSADRQPSPPEKPLFSASYKHRQQEQQRRQTMTLEIKKLKHACGVKKKISLINLLRQAAQICQDLKETEQQLKLRLNKHRYKNQALIHKEQYINAIHVLIHFQKLRSDDPTIPKAKKRRRLMENEVEQQLHCPYCGSSISILIEILSGSQDYIEDCEVCCKPINIRYEVENGQLTRFDYSRLDD